MFKTKTYYKRDIEILPTIPEEEPKEFSYDMMSFLDNHPRQQICMNKWNQHNIIQQMNNIEKILMEMFNYKQ